MFGNADGAYGSNVNQLIDSGRWQDEDELAETFAAAAEGFAYGPAGARCAGGLLRQRARRRQLAYQNLESVELGVTDRRPISTPWAASAGGDRRGRAGDASVAPVYIGDQTRGEGTVQRSPSRWRWRPAPDAQPQVDRGDAQARGGEGVPQSSRPGVTNTLGWSATTGQVPLGLPGQLTETFLDRRERLAAQPDARAGQPACSGP